MQEKDTKKKTTIEEMAEAGLHFGQAVSKRHPKMDAYIEGVKGSIHVINLQTTEEKLEECLKYLSELKKEGKMIMLVSTKPEFRNIVKEVAEECDMPYIINRFLGGMMTNFPTMKKRIDYYNMISKQRESGELERKYTKQERVKISKEMEGLEKKFGGVLKLERIPDAIFVVDMIKDKLAIKEARMCGVKVIAIADTNADPSITDCFIPANDDSISSVSYILNKIKAVLK
jgi:small subunit ribosomal protein S2